MRRVLDEEGRETPVRGRIADKPVQSLRVVTAAVGRRVVCRGTGVRADDVARGYYQNDGRILDDASRLVLKPLDFAAAAGNTSKRPFATITLESEPECSLHSLAEAHGVTTVAAESNPQNDPHCLICAGGESLQGNEILLCDGLRCTNCYHQRCCEPEVEAVPEGAWLCPECVARGNEADPQPSSAALHWEQRPLRLEGLHTGGPGGARGRAQRGRRGWRRRGHRDGSQRRARLAGGPVPSPGLPPPPPPSPPKTHPRRAHRTSTCCTTCSSSSTRRCRSLAARTPQRRPLPRAQLPPLSPPTPHGARGPGGAPALQPLLRRGSPAPHPTHSPPSW